MVASPLGLVALVVACADLRSPPPAASAGSAGADGTSSQAGASAAYGGKGAESGGAGGSSTGQGGSASASDAGSSGRGGSSGSSGGGASGQAGVGGTTVLSGASGEGGASAGAGGEPACERRDDGDIRAWLYQEITADKSNEIHPFIALTNAGLNVPLNQLAIRYYFSGEAAGDWQLSCLWVTKAGDMDHGFCDEGVNVRIVALDPPRSQADQYLEISFAGVANAGLSDGFPIEARTMFWRTGHPMLNLANDYSFVPTDTAVLNVGPLAYRQTRKVTVYRNGALVWGEEPCP